MRCTQGMQSAPGKRSESHAPKCSGYLLHPSKGQLDKELLFDRLHSRRAERSAYGQDRDGYLSQQAACYY